MSWGTEFSYDEYIIRRNFGSKAEILDLIEELEIEISDYESTLLMYVVSDPSIIPDKANEMSIPIAIKVEMQELFEFYKKTVMELMKVRNYLEVTKLK